MEEEDVNICIYCHNFSNNDQDITKCFANCENHTPVSNTRFDTCNFWSNSIILSCDWEKAKRIVDTQMKYGNFSYISYLFEVFLESFMSTQVYHINVDTTLKTVQVKNLVTSLTEEKDELISFEYTSKTKYGEYFEISIPKAQRFKFRQLFDDLTQLYLEVDGTVYVVLRYKTSFWGNLRLWVRKTEMPYPIVNQQEFQEFIKDNNEARYKKINSKK